MSLEFGHLCGHVRPRHHFLGQCNAQHGLEHRTEYIRVVRCRSKEPGDDWIRCWERCAVKKGVHLSNPHPVRRDLIPIKRGDLAFGLRVVRRRECRGIGDMLTGGVAEHLRVHEAEAQAPPRGRVGACPCVADGRKTGDDRSVVDDKSPIPVENAGHREDWGERLAI